MAHHGVVADDELDTLFQVRPELFTAKRTELAEAAKRRGDAAAAQRIRAARRPTTAAWIANRLALHDKRAEQRLADLGDRLRAAHSGMDGERIRELSAEQHALIDELSRAALRLAEVATPSAALRDDLKGTLQAAIADPEVRARLGRLTKAERWSGFGEFGDVTAVSATSRRAKSPPKAPPKKREPAGKPSKNTGEDQRADAAAKQREKLRATVTAAERALAEADEAVSERQAERDALQSRLDEAQEHLRALEREVRDAESRYQKAKRAGQAAAATVREAKAQLRRA
jgi:flagellin-like hook-associated protein FlgL